MVDLFHLITINPTPIYFSIPIIVTILTLITTKTLILLDLFHFFNFKVIVKVYFQSEAYFMNH